MTKVEVCPKCGVKHGNYESIEQALDIAMDESMDADCRLAAREWILNIFNNLRLDGGVV